MKKKVVLSIAYLLSLSPMLLNQYGGLKGVQEITGMINLLNPIGLLSFVAFAAGVWIPFKHHTLNRLLSLLGTVGIVLSEIYKFFTWHVMNITGTISLQNSIQLAFPEFYFGLAVSIAMVAAYLIIDKKMTE